MIYLVLRCCLCSRFFRCLGMFKFGSCWDLCVICRIVQVACDVSPPLYPKRNSVCPTSPSSSCVCRGDQDVEAAAVASRRLRSQGARERDAEIAKQDAVLNQVPEGDAFSVWAKTEDDMSRDQWQPLR